MRGRGADAVRGRPLPHGPSVRTVQGQQASLGRATGADVPGSTQPAPRLSRALGELGVGAEAFAALPAAARGLFGLLFGIKAAVDAYVHHLRLGKALISSAQ